MAASTRISPLPGHCPYPRPPSLLSTRFEPPPPPPPSQLSGTPPFKGRRDREVLQAVRRGKYTLSGPKWEAISEEAKVCCVEGVVGGCAGGMG